VILPPPVEEARRVGERATTERIEQLRTDLRRQLRRSVGVRGQPPPPCDDPALAYFPPDSVTRRLHADFPSMLIGGLAALLLQMLHPLAMAGVADFSNYRGDPLGRLARTAAFLGTTSFHSREEAAAAIARVRRIHAGVAGTAPDGRPYAAEDPALLTWVHAAEVRSFLNASVAYGPVVPSRADQDRYVDEMARVALDLGALEVPRSVAGLDAYFEAVRPELRLTGQARTARNFVLRGVTRRPPELATYGLLMAAAQGTLPGWARRQLRLPSVPAGDRLAVRPATRALAGTMRWALAT
jgi:uncharacterized protein (DUF2236 family)